MKHIITFLILFTSGLNGFSQVKFIYKDLNGDTILNRLYDCVSFDLDSQTLKKSGLWKPNLSEQLNSSLDHYSDFFMTQLDTILYFQKAKSKVAVAVFTTYNYEDSTFLYGGEIRPMKGLALFTKAENHWEITQFKKMFNSSEYDFDPTYTIEKFGEDLFCLKQENVQEFYGGHDIASTLYFSLTDFAEIFSFLRYYSENTTEVFENEDFHIKKKKINILKTKPYYTIELVTTTIKENYSKPNFKRKKIYKTTYRFSPKNNRYVKSSH